MSTRSDPLGGAPAPPDRVAYATGVMLSADDFAAEQLYHRGRLARALGYLAGHGTAAGLEVVVDPPAAGGTERLHVRPGVAVDRLGRLVEVPRDACLRLDRWLAAEPDDHLVDALKTVNVGGGPVTGVVADVFVRYVACERGLTPALASGPFDALDAVTASRLRDGYEITLLARREAGVPPLPRSPWPAPGAAIDDTRAALQRALFDAWRETDTWWTSDGLAPLPEHAPGQDASALFLARLVVPVDQPGGAGRPTRAAGAVQVDNAARSFVYPLGALARALGL